MEELAETDTDAEALPHCDALRERLPDAVLLRVPETDADAVLLSAPLRVSAPEKPAPAASAATPPWKGEYMSQGGGAVTSRGVRMRSPVPVPPNEVARLNPVLSLVTTILPSPMTLSTAFINIAFEPVAQAGR